MISFTPIKVKLLINQDVVKVGAVGTIIDLNDDLLYDVYFPFENTHLYLNPNQFEKIKEKS